MVGRNLKRALYQDFWRSNRNLQVFNNKIKNF
jgi:hypothetical protein